MSEFTDSTNPNTRPLEATTPSEVGIVEGAPREPQYSLDQLQKMGETLERLSAANITRRSVLKFGKAMCILAGTNAALHYVEQPIMKDLYGDHATKIIYSGTNVRRPVQHAGLVSQGFGLTQSNSIVNDLLSAEVYANSFPFGAYRCSTNGISHEGIERRGVEFREFLKPKEVDIYAISEGLMIALTGARGAGRPLRIVSSYDSPNDINDVYHNKIAKAIVLANKLGIYHGGLIGKYAACLLEEVDKDGLHELFTGEAQAYRSTVTGGDPRMMVSELNFMYNTNLLRDWRSFRGIVTPDTTGFILRTKQAETDKVVRDIPASEKLHEFYNRLGATAIELEIDTPGHADTSVGINTAAPHYKRILADSSF